MDAVSLKGYLAIAATILSVALATSPVHAVTQDEYENTVPERPGNDEAHVRATGGALKIAMNTEYVRAIRMGENQRAICLHDHFVPNKSGPREFYDLIGAVIRSDGPAVEETIVSEVNKICPKELSASIGAERIMDKSALSELSYFFNYYSDADTSVSLNMQLLILTLDIYTEIEFARHAGNQAFAQCINDKFAVYLKPPTARPGALKIVEIISNERNSETVTFEETVVEIILKPEWCGNESVSKGPD